jgi:hypothetical protein
MFRRRLIVVVSGKISIFPKTKGIDSCSLFVSFSGMVILILFMKNILSSGQFVGKNEKNNGQRKLRPVEDF